MRRPVGVKWIRSGVALRKVFSAESFACRHPSILTLDEQSRSLGASWAFSFQPVLPPDYRPAIRLLRIEPGPGVRRSHRNSALSFCFSFRRKCLSVFGLVLRCRHHPAIAVVQRFIHFSTHPQVMQQHRQLSCRRDDAPNTSLSAFAVVLTFCSSSTAPDSSSTQYQLERSPRSSPTVNFCSEIFLLAFVAMVLTFFLAGLLYLLCLEHVDNLGAYTASRPETDLLIPSVSVKHEFA
jgi:hypothetical protein